MLCCSAVQSGVQGVGLGLQGLGLRVWRFRLAMFPLILTVLNRDDDAPYYNPY